jgi:hypothetical protein
LESRLFLLDKNYTLKQVQQDLRSSLQADLIRSIQTGYFKLFNPLRLPDEKSQLVETYQPSHLSHFDELYEILCGIYRYQIGDNQLELLFDGRSHYEKYEEDWKMAFIDFIEALCLKKNFILAGLELSVFYHEDNRLELAQNRMKVCIYEHFGLKIYKHKGIQTYKRNQA